MLIKKTTISLLLIMLCAMLLSACAAQPRLWLAKSISSAGLKVDGRASDQVVLKLPNQVIAASINRATVQSLLDVHAKMDVAAHMHSILYITNRGEPYANAYAAIIGDEYIIAINLSMIELLGSDQSMHAALIGHEVAHHIKQHKSAAALMNKMLFNYDQETEADELGLQLMNQAGYPLGGAITFYQKLSQSRSHHYSFLSSHPRGEERLEHIKAVISAMIHK